MKIKPKKKYAKGISFYPLKPEEVLSAFMKVDSKKVMVEKREININVSKKPQLDE
jgi:hypothetical protein